MKVLRGILIVFLALIIISGLAIGYVFFDNSRVVNTEYTYTSPKVPSNFDGYRIALITDFHNGENYMKVAQTVKKAQPDIICIVGDLISMNTEDYSNAKNLVKELTAITDVYYVYGNHEYYNATYFNVSEPPIGKELEDTDVKILNNKGTSIEKDGQLINLLGYGDSIHGDTDGAFWQHAEPFMKKMSSKIDKSVLSIMLIHRSQFFENISSYPFDLVLGGHLHGGQVNIAPIRKKILLEHFGTDKYCKGEYFKNGHELIISGGLERNDGIRVFNTPEIVTVTLKTEN